MFATMSTTQTGVAVCQNCTQSMPFSPSFMPAMDKMYMAAVVSMLLIIGTGAVASVSLFVVVLFVVALLLVSLVVVLTCLTGPISLQGLVGQTQNMVRLATCMTQGE